MKKLISGLLAFTMTFSMLFATPISLLADDETVEEIVTEDTQDVQTEDAEAAQTEGEEPVTDEELWTEEDNYKETASEDSTDPISEEETDYDEEWTDPDDVDDGTDDVDDGTDDVDDGTDDVIYDRDPKDFTENRLESSMFDDQNLYQLIYEMADSDGDGIVPLVELELVEFLDLSSDQITSLKGLEVLPDLATLQLSGNFGSYEPLRKVTALEYFYANDTNFSDISVLSNNKELKEVFVDSTSVTNISAVSSLPSLEAISCRYTSVSDISVLGGCQNLVNVDLTGCPVSDFSCLAGKTSLTNLSIEGDGAVDLSFLYGLTNMVQLNIRKRGATSIDFVSNMKQLVYLYIDGNSVSDISPVANCKKLQDFCTNGNPISDFSPLKSCPNLGALTIESGLLTDLSFLSGMNLNYLAIWCEAGVSDYSIISALTGLENLTLAGCCIQNCPDFTGLTKLEYFTFAYNYVSREELMTKVPARFANDEAWLEESSHVEETVNLAAEGEAVRFEGDVLSDTTLTVEKTDEYDVVFEKVAELTDADYEVYNISLEHDMMSGTSDGTVCIQAAGDSDIYFTNLPDGEYKVYRREADDTVTELSCKAVNGQLCFTTEHYSIFALVRVNDGTGASIKASDRGPKPIVFIIIGAAIVAAAGVAITLIMVNKKKKAAVAEE